MYGAHNQAMTPRTLRGSVLCYHQEVFITACQQLLCCYEIIGVTLYIPPHFYKE
jgi:hypothetical protein